MVSGARFEVADFVRSCASSSSRRERADRTALVRFAAYLEGLPENDRRPDVLFAIAGGHAPYRPGPAVRNAVVRSLRRGVDPTAVLEALIVFASAESLAQLRDRYIRGEVSS